MKECEFESHRQHRRTIDSAQLFFIDWSYDVSCRVAVRYARKPEGLLALRLLLVLGYRDKEMRGEPRGCRTVVTTGKPAARRTDCRQGDEDSVA